VKPCLTCQTPSDGSYCDEHTPKPWQHREASARRRGYSTAWDKLSRRARKLQPFCSDCGATEDLQLDHTERTWQRHEAGKVIRLKDTGGVVCGPCNRARGAARGRGEDHGTGPLERNSGPGQGGVSVTHRQPNHAGP
jgi:5-methylcytosine-specific restriction enzyme A